MIYLLDGPKIIEIAKKNKVAFRSNYIIAILQKHGFVLTRELKNDNNRLLTKQLYKKIINGNEEVSAEILDEIAKILKCKYTDIIFTGETYGGSSSDFSDGIHKHVDKFGYYQKVAGLGIKHMVMATRRM